MNHNKWMGSRTTNHSLHRPHTRGLHLPWKQMPHLERKMVMILPQQHSRVHLSDKDKTIVCSFNWCCLPIKGKSQGERKSKFRNAKTYSSSRCHFSLAPKARQSFILPYLKALEHYTSHLQPGILYRFPIIITLVQVIFFVGFFLNHLI